MPRDFITAAVGDLRPHRYRALLLSHLQGPEPLSAQALYARLRADGLRIGLSTIYRELHLLAGAGRARELRIDGEAVYDTSQHDLVICDVCGAVRRLDRQPPSLSRLEVLSSFFADGAVVVHGACRDCRPAAG